MIRAAVFLDIPRIEELLREMHAASKYAGRSDISDKTMREVLMHLVSCQRQPGPAGTMAAVAEHDGVVEGFIAGQLDRVYHIGKKLVANDVYLHVSSRGKTADVFRLIDAYIAWGFANPKVIEMNLSWKDTLPGADRVAAVYRRKGCVKVGEIFEMRLDAPAQAVAA